MDWIGEEGTGKDWNGSERKGWDWMGVEWKGLERIKKEMKKMKKYEVTIEGTAPLLQNKIPDLEGTEKKGEGKDNAEQCENKLYKINEKIVQPAIHIEQALIKVSGGIKQKGQGKKSFKDLFKGSVFIKPEYIEHEFQKWEIHKSTCVIPATKGRITRYRPILPKWKLTFEIEVLDDRLTTDVLKLALDEAGRVNGLGDYRPRYGRFIITKFKEL